MRRVVTEDGMISFDWLYLESYGNIIDFKKGGNWVIPTVNFAPNVMCVRESGRQPSTG